MWRIKWNNPEYVIQNMLLGKRVLYNLQIRIRSICPLVDFLNFCIFYNFLIFSRLSEQHVDPNDIRECEQKPLKVLACTNVKN